MPGGALDHPSGGWFSELVVAITVFLADDSVIIREGVRAMLDVEPDFDVVGVADDYDSLRSRRRGGRIPMSS